MEQQQQPLPPAAYIISVTTREGGREFQHSTRGIANSPGEMYLDASVGLGVVCGQTFPRPLTVLARAAAVVAEASGTEEHRLSPSMSAACDQFVHAATQLIQAAAEYDAQRGELASHAKETVDLLHRVITKGK